MGILKQHIKDLIIANNEVVVSVCARGCPGGPRCLPVKCECLITSETTICRLGLLTRSPKLINLGCIY